MNGLGCRDNIVAWIAINVHRPPVRSGCVPFDPVHTSQYTDPDNTMAILTMYSSPIGSDSTSMDSTKATNDPDGPAPRRFVPSILIRAR